MVANLASLLNSGHTRRLVIKIGSALLVEGGQPRSEWLASLIADVAECRAKGSVLDHPYRLLISQPLTSVARCICNDHRCARSFHCVPCFNMTFCRIN